MADVTTVRNVTKLTAEELEFRDDAALAALSGLISDLDPGEVAKLAYEFADAMLAARKGGGEVGK